MEAVEIPVAMHLMWRLSFGSKSNLLQGELNFQH